MSSMSSFASGLFAVIAFAGYATSKDASEDSFRQCIITKPSANFGYCLGLGAITKLQSLDSEPEFDIVDGVTFSRGEQQYREAYNFVESDPGSFRTIVDSVGHVFSSRNMRWDMSTIYPGLALHVAPSLASGGVLEFVLDPHRETVTKHNLKEASTGRLLARQFLVPLLLGFKFNVATLVPILFGVLALIAKKAIILSKLALVVSSAYAIGSLLFSTSSFNSPVHHYQQSYNPSFGGHYNRYQEEDYPESIYRVNNIKTDDQVRLHGSIPVQEVYARGDKAKGRNFAWSEAEKDLKT